MNSTSAGQYKCSVCGYVHDNSDGDFASLPADWVCPWCKADKSAFVDENAAGHSSSVDTSSVGHVDSALNPLECSIVCSNLARGCDKQYLAEESRLLYRLSQLFLAKQPAVDGAQVQQLQQAVAQDISHNLEIARAIAVEHADRGAQRAIVWSTKVTTVLRALIDKYAVQGDAMVANTNIYVCSICGFVYVGDSALQLCPICKVPSYKFDKIEGDI